MVKFAGKGELSGYSASEKSVENRVIVQVNRILEIEKELRTELETLL